MSAAKLKFDSKDAQERVSAFCLHADWIEAIFKMYVELYYFDDTLQLIDKKNELWYHLSAKALIHCILMEFSKVTDPKDSGVDKENLSVNYIVDSIDWPSEVARRLDDLRNRMTDFGIHIMPARHKMLAHISVEAAVSRKRYGAFPAGKDTEFVRNLHDFCEIAYKASIHDRWGVPHVRIGYRADIQHLKTSLAKARAFDAILLEPDPTKARMLSLLEGQFKTPLRPLNWDYQGQPEQDPGK
jgi:hypothetical protein